MSAGILLIFRVQLLRPLLKSIADTIGALCSGRVSSTELTQDCLKRIKDPLGEGSRTFVRLHEAAALAEARASDLLRQSGLASAPLTGVPISVKDNFDVAGHATTAGSVVLSDAPKATRDAAVVARLRSAGAVILGQTNMSEFAYSGVGLNPHYGTPRNPYERAVGRIPGGSSSGAAISVADCMAVAAVGSDTGGSARVPAALCGLVGFKPTLGRHDRTGLFPMAPSFDTVGVLGHTVSCCYLIDAVMSGTEVEPIIQVPVKDLRIGIPTDYVVENLDPSVSSAFDASLATLEKAGARLNPVRGVDWQKPVALLEEGGLMAVECLVEHGKLFERRDQYDPRVAIRIERAVNIPASAYLSAQEGLSRIRQDIAKATRDFDVVIMPTVPCIAPPIGALAELDDYLAVNNQVLRNTRFVNLLNQCAITIPIQKPDQIPVGLMLVGGFNEDKRLFAIAGGIEKVLNGEQNFTH